MESNFRNREFEQFLKENADQHRMFPSENVWKEINAALHTRRKWYAAGLTALLLLTGTAVTLVMVNYPDGKQPVLSAANIDHTKDLPSPEQIEKINESILPFKGKVATASPAPQKDAPFRQEANNTESSFINSNTQLEDPLYHEYSQRNTFKQVSGESKPNETEAVFTTIVDNDVETLTAGSNDVETQQKLSPVYPLTIESVTNNFTSKKGRSKMQWQFFITPTVSYRRLNSNKDVNGLPVGAPMVTGSPDVNSAVIHKPDLGLQIGTSFHYPLTKVLKLRGGVQFNINRYDIKAYTSSPEVATIRLNDQGGLNSVWTWTYYRNFNGYKANWLKNYYFSVSAPIGLELKVAGNKKTSIGIAGTLQPTYILRDKAYLLSTDYKNYAKVPSLVRHLNVNGGLEAYVNHTNGRTRWQIGPQVRYQMLSSFQKEYPVKEHLFDFGLRIGVFLNDK